jgi:hypothetical protein
MISHARIVAQILCAALLILPVSATYAGDKPLVTAFSGTLNGGYVFSTGNSTYSGTLYPGDRYPVTFSIDLPGDAVIRYQRYYVYWAWSRQDQQAVYPSLTVTCCNGPESPALPSARYVDNKGFSSPSDFYSGMDTFSGGNLSPGRNEVTFEVENTGTGNSTFVIQGTGILAVYSSPASPGKLIVVKEGCDMLYNSYGITPEMATSTVVFEDTIDQERMTGSTLELIAPSGGYTRSDVIQKNAVYFNGQQKSELPGFFTAVLDLIFPQAKGKAWVDVFDSDNQQQIGIEKREVTPYIVGRSNFASVQDRGDYLLFTNAILQVEYA